MPLRQCRILVPCFPDRAPALALPAPGRNLLPLRCGDQANYPIPNDPSGRRGVPDVSYDGNPNTGFAVYDTVRYHGQSGWFQVGGTSAGAPQWAALFAIANSMRVAGTKATLSSTNNAVYSVASGGNLSSNFHDIVSGTNGSCGTLCTAVTGYDYVTGLGSPQANNVIPALVSQ